VPLKSEHEIYILSWAGEEEGKEREGKWRGGKGMLLNQGSSDPCKGVRVRP